MKIITGNTSLDYALIILPIWFAVLMHTAFFVFSAYAAIIFLVAFFLFGETHFAATWLFFLDPKNRKWILSNPIYFIYIPFCIVAVLLFLYFSYSLASALFLSSVFSAFHVTRQSVGVSKLYGKRGSKALRKGEYLIYIFSGVSLIVGFFRFYFTSIIPVSSETMRAINSPQIYILTIGGALILSFCYMLIISRNEGQDIALPMSVLTGMFLYFPYCFVPRVEYCVVACVGMHYLQYLGIVVPLYTRKGKRLKESGDHASFSKFIGNMKWVLVYIVGYSALMVSLRVGENGFNSFEYSNLFILPIILQTFHYYADMFIWRFSNQHIRQEVGSYMFSPQEEVVSV